MISRGKWSKHTVGAAVARLDARVRRELPGPVPPQIRGGRSGGHVHHTRRPADMADAIEGPWAGCRMRP